MADLGAVAEYARAASQKYAASHRRISTLARSAADKVADALRRAEQEDATDEMRKAALKEVHDFFTSSKLRDNISKAQRDAHAHVSKLGKVIDKHLDTGAPRLAHRSLTLDRKQIFRVISSHLLRTGRLRLAERIAKDTGLSEEMTGHLDGFVSLNAVLDALDSGNTAPALDWVGDRYETMSAAERSLAFSLHRLKYLEFVRAGTASDAIAYAKAHFPAFQTSHYKEIKALLGCLVFLKHPEVSPYKELFANELWNDAKAQFSQLACMKLGLPPESLLQLCVSAGCKAIPPLLKYISIRTDADNNVLEEEQLPVEVPLGKDFVFQSVFVCPITREQWCVLW